MSEKDEYTKFEKDFINEISTYAKNKGCSVNVLFTRVGYVNHAWVSDFANQRGKSIGMRLAGKVKAYMAENPIEKK